MDEYIIDPSDQISPLPDFILHHILAFLDSYTDLVKVSVLSKRWFTLWATFPILDFDIFKMAKALKAIKCKQMGTPAHTRMIDLDLEDQAKENLIKYATNTLSRFSQHKIAPHKFKLDIRIDKAIEATYFDKWISFVIEKGVRVLDVCVWAPLDGNKYRLPKTLLSARSLTSLTLTACELTSSVLVDGIKLTALKSLCLKMVHVDERAIKRLTTTCPLIEEFKVLGCRGFNVFSVFGCQNLQRIKAIFLNYDEIEADIKASNLTDLSISNALGKAKPRINLFSCNNLITLRLGRFKLGTTWFCELIRNCPLLENVHLHDCKLEKSFKILSHSLRKFELGYCNDMEEIQIDSPNLVLFRYVGDVGRPLLSLTSDFAKLEARMYVDLKNERDIRWFLKLRRFLGEENKFNVLELYIHIGTDSLNVDELKETRTTPYELEHLELTISPLSLVLPPTLVDAVLWCCHPRSLTFLVEPDLLHFEKMNKIFKYVYEKLLHQTDECQKEIEIAIVGGSKTEKGFISLESLLDALACLEEGQEIIFRTKSHMQEPRSNSLVEWEISEVVVKIGYYVQGDSNY